MADNWKWIVGVIAVIALIMIFTGHLKLGGTVLLQSVIGTDCPRFKTNSAGDYGLSTVWVAADCNGDDVFEGYGYQGITSPTNKFPVTGQTPDGKDYYCGNGYLIVLKTGTSFPIQYWNMQTNAGAYRSADLTCAPACTPNWSCGSWSSCSLGTQTRTCTDANSCGVTSGKPAESQSCTVLTFVCDANSDGIIDRTELGNVITKWSGG